MMNILRRLEGNTTLRKLHIDFQNNRNPNPCYCTQCEHLGQDQIEAFGRAVSKVYRLTDVNPNLRPTDSALLNEAAHTPLMWNTLKVAGRNPFAEENTAQDVVLALPEVSSDTCAIYSYLGENTPILSFTLPAPAQENITVLGSKSKAAQMDSKYWQSHLVKLFYWILPSAVVVYSIHFCGVH